jgi:hypothetical protein
MVKPLIVWGNLSFRKEGVLSPDRKGKKFHNIDTVDFNFTKLCFSSLTAVVTTWHVSFKFFQALLLYLKERPEPICLEHM